MSRYIDADEFLEDESEAYMRAQVNLAKENADKTIDATRYVNEAVHKKIQMLIKEAPSADVVEVRHGRWERLEEPSWTVNLACRCQICGWTVNNTQSRAFAYCPNCGARMDGDEQEHE